MTNDRVAGKQFTAMGAAGHTFETYPNREARLGSLPIARAMPIRQRRMVGPWCFLDHFGPLAFSAGRAMDVPPHPHIGIQTVSWLLEGEVQHSDSLGNQATIRPGGVNVMTAARGIAHAEETPARHSGRLHGVQLWVALLEAHRSGPPEFTSVAQVPLLEARGGVLRIFAGRVGDVGAPELYFSRLLGLEAQLHAGGALEFELDPGFEHALLLLDGDGSFERQPLGERTLYYLGSRRQGLSLHSQAGGRVLLIGGPPFPETILMWWNFVARTPQEIAGAHDDWEAQRRFGEVVGRHSPRLAAPQLVRFARPNPAS
jgi:redox-sensitive bicupin YhaK (pirin superfamily)